MVIEDEAPERPESKRPSPIRQESVQNCESVIFQVTQESFGRDTVNPF